MGRFGRGCERNASLQAILTDDFLAHGNGRWTFSFEVRARSETATKLNVRLYSNERSEAKAVDVTEKPSPDALTPWKRFEVAFDTKFDPKVTDLVALFVSTQAPTDELVFRDFRFVRASDKVEEVNVREGVGNFLRKIREGKKEIVVAYLGGSITAMTGWRDLTTDWLKKTYPGVMFKEIHASIGGTGSNLGMFRLERDVLSKKPDLVFLDFACNDGGEHTKLAPTCCYEYLVREMVSREIGRAHV